MSDRVRTVNELLAIFADNNSNQITAQDLRDFVVTTDNWRSHSHSLNLSFLLSDNSSISIENDDVINLFGGTGIQTRKDSGNIVIDGFSGDYNDLINKPSSSNVTITGGTITGISTLESSYINSSFINTGLILESNTFSTSKICIRSPITDFTQNNSINIFSTPNNYMFLFDSLEIVTISSVGTNTTLKIKVGDDNDSSEFLSESLVNSSTAGDRHIVDVAHNAVLPSRTLNFAITHPSSANSHSGVVIINGSLIKTN